MNVRVSPNFKKMASKAILAIILFIITYLLLIVSAIGITIICVWGGFALIIASPMAVTIGLGIGLASVGFFVLIFLFKFLFKKHKVDRSHLIEVFEHQEPRLFAFIRDIVQEVETDFPKKIYLSSDVNACVFYDSNFWSMVFPIRKNLQIGLGMINIISEQEFKAILAHEFGHFSQRSMKVGSYVYNVNQIIYNLLNDNESFNNMIQKWSDMSGYFSIFVNIAVKIIHSIQWVLSKMYNIVNLNYMALSREMEFHADEIAANVTGFLPLKESLLRMDLANYAFNNVLDYYENKIKDNIKSKNIYKEQIFVMNLLASKNNLAFKNDLPLVSELDLSKYNKSKLTIINQWASHPSTEERIKALELINIQKSGVTTPAMYLFKQQEQIEEKVTNKMFESVNYSGNVTSLDFEEFKNDYSLTFKKNDFPFEYNSYYDRKNPIVFDINNVIDFSLNETIEMLFSKENVDMVYDYIALDNDIHILNNIANKGYEIKSFDYDGKKYNASEAEDLIPNIEVEKNNLKEAILENDIKIYKFFHNASEKHGNAKILKEKYNNLFIKDSSYGARAALYSKISDATAFVSVQTPFEQIKANFKELLPLEQELKTEIRMLLEDELLVNEITQSIRDNFEKYLSKQWEYFYVEVYNDENLDILFNASNNFSYLLARQYFLVKLDLLHFQIAQLEK